MASEEVTESVLTDYLHTRGGEVVRSSRLSGLENRDGGALATIEHNGATEQVLAKWIVGCDGSHRAARKLGGIELDGHGIPQDWAVFDMTVEGWPDSYEANYDYLEEVPLILTALPGERWRAYVRPSSPDSDLVKDAWSTMSAIMAGSQTSLAPRVSIATRKSRDSSNQVGSCSPEMRPTSAPPAKAVG
jgi:2-polyprenyl-6-methoxyphenol hydroxylase-like FAD-dependent oxidoreductase